jgi:actin
LLKSINMAEAVAVIDIGGSSVKAGWAGDDVPSLIFPSVLATGFKKDVECVEADWRGASGEDMVSPIQRGCVRDWKKLESLLSITFDKLGVSTPGDSVSVLLTESPKASASDRVILADMLFTQFGVPSISIGNSASLSVFAAGRTSSVVVEMGAGVTSVVPVYEGLALTHASIPVEFGGQDISASLQRQFADRGVEIDMAVSRYLKEKMAFVLPTGQEPKSKEKRNFVLPDGTEVSVENNIFSDCTAAIFGGDKGNTSGGIGATTFESLMLCDESIRKDISQHIIVAGGTSMLPGLFFLVFDAWVIIAVAGLGDRLSYELNNRIHEMCDSKGRARYDCRVLPSSTARYANLLLSRSFCQLPNYVQRTRVHSPAKGCGVDWR